MTERFSLEMDLDSMTNVGAVRGRDVYELTTRRQLVTGAGNSLHVVIDFTFDDSA